MKEDFLHKKLDDRRHQNNFRQLRLPADKIDFCSNDYLGIAGTWSGRFRPPDQYKAGSTGSRLLTGNYKLIEDTEQFIASFHHSEAALIFNSGYDANTGLLSSVPQRGDTILYDHLSHASIRDGIRLSFAQSFSFQHNDMDDLENKLKKILITAGSNIFIITESIFSMDGDICPLTQLVTLCEKYNVHLIIDEAHATGVMGEKGEGLVQLLKLESKVFARIHTFGKALGVHGAVVLGSKTLRDYLINFARSFIFSTALPEQTIADIKTSYELFPGMMQEREQLQKLIRFFQRSTLNFEHLNSLTSSTPIQGIIIPGNEQVKRVADRLQQNKLDVRPILYPSVQRGQERLRIVLHSYNTEDELNLLGNCLKNSC